MTDEVDGAPPERAEPQVYVPIRFVDVTMVLPSTHPILVLEEIDAPHRQLRIPIGSPEGIAIAYGARQITTPKPLTHQLVANLLAAFGVLIEVVRITRVEGAAYDAEIICSGNGTLRTLKCRVSDAVALALRQDLLVPLTARLEVLERAGFARSGES